MLGRVGIVPENRLEEGLQWRNSGRVAGGKRHVEPATDAQCRGHNRLDNGGTTRLSLGHLGEQGHGRSPLFTWCRRNSRMRAPYWAMPRSRISKSGTQAPCASIDRRRMRERCVLAVIGACTLPAYRLISAIFYLGPQSFRHLDALCGPSFFLETT